MQMRNKINPGLYSTRRIVNVSSDYGLNQPRSACLLDSATTNAVHDCAIGHWSVDKRIARHSRVCYALIVSASEVVPLPNRVKNHTTSRE